MTERGRTHRRPRRGPDHGHVHGGAPVHRRVVGARRHAWASPPAAGLGTALRRLGFTVGRLKTGTPARGLGRSLDRGRMEEQPSDPSIVPFSFAAAADRPARRSLLDHPHERRDPPDHPGVAAPLAAVRGAHRGPGPALLPLDRGQGGPVPRPGTAPGVRRARGTVDRRGVPERRLHVAARGRAGAVPPHHPRPRAPRDRAPRLRGRVRLPPAHAAHPGAHDEARRGALRRGPDQRHLGLRGGRGAGHRGRASTRRAGCAARSRWCSPGPRPTSAC